MYLWWLNTKTTDLPEFDPLRQQRTFMLKKSKQGIEQNTKLKISGQSYKGFTIVNYNSRVVPDLKMPHITTLWS